MKWLARIFVHAIVRRVAYVLVALLGAALVSLFAVGNARAQDIPGCVTAAGGGSAVCDTAPQAKAWAEAWPRPEHCARAVNPYFLVNHLPDKKRFEVREYYGGGGCGQQPGWSAAKAWATYRDLCQAGATWDEELQLCNDCDSRPVMGAGAWSGANSEDQICLDNCVFQGGSGGGGVGVCMGMVIDRKSYTHCTSWGPTGDACPAPANAPGLAPPDTDGDGTSDGNDRSPNNPGSGGGGGGGDDGDEPPPEDGSSACGGEGQEPCAADGSNAGSGRGNTSGGGGDCNTPPSSTGDAILAQIAFQTWATRCAIVATANAGPGGGTGGGVGTGDGDGAKEGTLKGIKDFLDGNGEGIGDPEDPWMDGLPGEGSDWSLGLGSGSCPAPVSTVVTLGGVSAPIEFSFQPLCDLAGLLRTVFMALGALIAAYIVAGVRR